MAPDAFGTLARMLAGHRLRCPYCGEAFETTIDTSAGDADYIEDCPVCCRPIQFRIETEHDGTLTRVVLGRDDD